MFKDYYFGLVTLSAIKEVGRGSVMRILVADDDRGVLAAYKAAFGSLAGSQKETELSSMAASLFSNEDDAGPSLGKFHV